MNTLRLLAAPLTALFCVQLVSVIDPASAVAQEYTYPEDLRQPPEIYSPHRTSSGRLPMRTSPKVSTGVILTCIPPTPPTPA